MSARKLRAHGQKVACGALLFCAFTLSARADGSLDAWWTLDGTLVDASGNGNTLQLNGSPSFGAGTGSYTQALDLAGGQSASTIGTPGFSLFGSDFTISLWADFGAFNPQPESALPNTFVAEDNGGGGQQKWVFYYDYSTDSLGFHVNNGSPQFYEVSLGSQTPSTGSWNMFTVAGAVGLSSASLSFYYDGALMGTVDNVELASPSANITIGQAEGIGQLTGGIGDIQIYNGALTASQVGNLYSSDSPDAPEPATYSTILAGALLFGLREAKRRSSGR